MIYGALERGGIERPLVYELRRPLTGPQELEVCRRYQEGEIQTALAGEFGASRPGIVEVLKRHGVQRRTRSEANRRHQCNHSFFNAIDTEVKAYWLGMMAADGCISGRNALKLALACCGREHLARFRCALQSEHPIKEYSHLDRPRNQRRTISSFVVVSAELTTALANQGVTPAKTWTLRWPEHLEDDLLRHYLRGYIDGDRGFYVSRSLGAKRATDRRARIWFAITGNKQFLLGCQQYLVRSCSLSYTKLAGRADTNALALHYTGARQTSRIFRLLYDDATVWLPRKRDKVAPYIL
jgi:hypothetical protein